MKKKPMTSRERMLTALGRGMPDRLPATVHQWLDYHRNKHLGGMTALEAFRKFRLDAAITFFPHRIPADDPDWRLSTRHSKTPEGTGLVRTTVTTPGGVLTETSESDPTTAWIVERMVKRHDDIELLRKYMPVPGLDRDAVSAMRKDIGDDGILRGGLFGHQGGPWQDACCLYGTQEMILETFDHPDWVREFLDVLTEKRLLYIERELAGAEFDLIETGGGAASSTVISPTLFRDFCLPVDRKIHDALHAAGHKVVYHTCGGMMPILEMIVENGCDASETLSPREVGGDARPAELKRRIGGKVALIGGFNQFQVLSEGTHEEIRRSVQDCFETYGVGGGYIMCPSDHFFETPLENLYCYSDAAKECVYR
jgi:uroporphyrinogen-III decarboxylase